MRPRVQTAKYFQLSARELKKHKKMDKPSKSKEPDMGTYKPNDEMTRPRIRVPRYFEMSEREEKAYKRMDKPRKSREPDMGTYDAATSFIKT